MWVLRIGAGTRVKFFNGTGRPILNSWLDLSGQTGRVVLLDAHTLAVKLDKHDARLDEWENEVIWTLDDTNPEGAQVLVLDTISFLTGFLLAQAEVQR